MLSKQFPYWNQLESIAHLLLDPKENNLSFLNNAYTAPLKTRNFHVHIHQQLINSGILDKLIHIAELVSLKKKITALFQGDDVNGSEHKKALHTLLRGSMVDEMHVNQIQYIGMVEKSLNQLETISNRIRRKQWVGYTGKPIRHVVNIGIGGSYLGPKLVLDALKFYASKRINVEFVSNIDPWDIEDTLYHTKLEETLFIISSKSFETIETLANARIAMNAYGNIPEHIAKHFIAITSYPDKARQLGVQESNIIQIGDWVGGRYSVWSAISLPVVIAIGMRCFKDFLLGGHQMDCHFLNSPFKKNIPVILGLIDIWNINFLQAESIAIIPYAKRLRYLVPYLAQLYMESLGKSYNSLGQPVEHKTGAILWGDIGTNSQHSFHQLIMQGTHLIPCDFILPLNTNAMNKRLHEELKINCYAQIEALKLGRHDHDPHHEISGNKPCTLIEIHKITPYVMGQLIALYEHRVFTQAAVWDINPFDQFGVELGKVIACQKKRSK